MATVVLDAYSKAYPSITNRIRASVFSESDPLTIVASIIDSTSGHPTRIWHFPGLPRDNYGFSLDEIDGSGDPVNNLALFDVVPGTLEGLLTRADEQIRVDVTPGLVAGATNFVFDGTGGKPDYIGWSIRPTEQGGGRGLMIRGLDYSWDSVTGTLALLQGGDIFSSLTYYNIHFDPAQGLAGDSVPTITDFSQRIVTTNDAILVEDFGNSIIAEPGGPFIELTLPAINTVAVGRVLILEVAKVLGQTVSCVKISKNGSDVINFMDGSLYMMSNETLKIYRLRRPDLSNEWRVIDCNGNFRNIGQSTDEDATSTLVYCKHLFDGAVESSLQYARLYNQYILTLPPTQLVDFDAWATGNNKYFYSKANSANPSNANKFHFPDRRDLFSRNNNSGKAGDFALDSIKTSDLFVQLFIGDSFLGPAGGGWTSGTLGRGQASRAPFNFPIQSVLGVATETKPKNYLINKYVLV